MSMLLSVVICTHNPRAEYLTRTLAALKVQTLPVNEWELLVIDNASKDPVAPRFDISWHPHGRHVCENELGLTQARVRGIKESSGELIVFVDDDNLLDPDYLEQAVRIGTDFPFLGVWGGSAVPEFEVSPESWIQPYLPFLALRECERDTWSNLLSHNESVPNGAGLCLRRSVADRYASRVLSDERHKRLDRRGEDLLGGGDHALVFTGCEMGYGCGSMKALRLTHLIPEGRLSKEYILRLMERFEYSHVLFRHLMNGHLAANHTVETGQKRGLFWNRLRKFASKAWTRREYSFEEQVAAVRQKGREDGIRAILGRCVG
jgi:glycosyltransferase involved in cell wall biosynthesis